MNTSLSVLARAVARAQLVEQSLPTPEIRVSNPIIGKFIYQVIYQQFNKTDKEKKRPGMAQVSLADLTSPLNPLQTNRLIGNKSKVN